MVGWEKKLFWRQEIISHVLLFIIIIIIHRKHKVCRNLQVWQARCTCVVNLKKNPSYSNCTHLKFSVKLYEAVFNPRVSSTFKLNLSHSFESSVIQVKIIFFFSSLRSRILSVDNVRSANETTKTREVAQNYSQPHFYTWVWRSSLVPVVEVTT